MSTSRLDAVYRSILITKFFTKGWGKPENLRRLFEFRKVVSNRDECFNLVERDYPVTITKEQNLSDCKLLEGYFVTPLERYLPGIVPEIAQKAHFQALLPVHWPEPGCKPVCLHLAGTGDHGPLLQDMAVLFFLFPIVFLATEKSDGETIAKGSGHWWNYIGKPFLWTPEAYRSDVSRSSLHNVSDIFVMGGCLILESLVLFHWCERNGLGPLGVTGLSMGGHMASLAATNWPKPLVLVPCLSWSTASAVFLQGVMSHSINWDLLEDQYLSDGVYREKLSKMVTIVDEAFLAGKKFARTYSEKVESDTQTSVQKEKQENLITSLKSDSKKNVDVTYNEAIVKDNLKNDVAATKNNVDTKINDIDAKANDTDAKPSAIENRAPIKIKSAQIQSLSGELKVLLGENKISKTLYDKLTSNTTFELDAGDISEINKLNKNELKDFLLIFRLADECTNSTTTVKDEIPDEKKVENKIDTNIKVVFEKQIADDDNLKDEKVVSIKMGEEIEVGDKKLEKKSWNVSDLTSDLWTSLPFLKPSGKKIDIGKIHWRDREALQFMRGIMDECTHLSNFSVPYDTSLIIAVCAKHDAYVPREDVGRLEEIWPGAEVRYVDAGHVSAYILHQSVFRACIREAFERSKKRWIDGKHIE